VLPARVAGALLVIDLKNSEAFFRDRARRGLEVDQVATWRLTMRVAIEQAGGVVILTKGDEIISLFDENHRESPILRALSATREMARLSATLSADLAAQGQLPAGLEGIHFRGALTTGALRPGWDVHGDHKEPVWQEAGTSMPLVTAARLLEQERTLNTKRHTVVILSEADASKACAGSGELVDRFIRRDWCTVDRTGAEQRLAAYDASSSTVGSLAA
jgi:hypothetical protein